MSEQYPHPLDAELEAEATEIPQITKEIYLSSIAISLKRIADFLIWDQKS